MSYKSGDVFVIEPEQPQQCDMCGRIEELRPYGPNGQCICFECGQKDPDGTMKRFLERVDSASSEGSCDRGAKNNDDVG